jgi:hypothetical protein
MVPISEVFELSDSSATKASTERRSRDSHKFSLNPFEDDTRSTESGGSSSSSKVEIESFPKDRVEYAAPKTVKDTFEEGWYTPTASDAECREIAGASPTVEAAVAAALAGSPVVTPALGVLRQRHSDIDWKQVRRECQQDWFDDADTKVVPGLEAAPCLSRLVGADMIKHPGLASSKRPAPWTKSESHAEYHRLGARDASSSYVSLWLNVGDTSFLTVSEVVDRPALERCLASDPLSKRLKLLIRAVKCPVPFPSKGAKDADTIGDFFGKGANLSRIRTAEGVDVLVLQVDLFFPWMLKFALSNFGIRQGNVVDLIVCDWPGQAVLTSFRLDCTETSLKKLNG